MTKKIPTQEGKNPELDLLQAALNHINQGFSVFDKDLKLVAWNNALFDMLDFPTSLGRRGTHISEFLRVNAARGEYGPGQIDEIIAKHVAIAYKFKSHAFERVRPNGQVIAIRGGPLPNGGFVSTYSDITRERETQLKLERTVEERTHALRQSEDWLRLVTDNLPVMIAYIAPGLVYRFASAPYAKWFARTPASIYGQKLEEVVGPDLFQIMKPHAQRALAGELVVYEYCKSDKNNQDIHMRSTLVPDRTKDGRTLGCFVLSFDVTDQKESEARLLQAQRMDAVGQLSGGLAHDFNNLLSIIIGNGLTLRRKLAQGPLSQLQAEQYINPTLEAAERGANLTRRLLSFATGNQFEATNVSLNTVLQETAKLLAGFLPQTIALFVSAPPPALQAHVDPTLLENALINLAVNAKDAMPEGGTIEIKLEHVKLGHASAQKHEIPAGDYALFQVLDTGSGFTNTVKSQAFDPFFTTKDHGKGSGLGLAMVYGFAKQSGGAITLANRTKKGALASLYLPCRLSSPQGQTDKASAQALPPMGNGQLIVIVEDEADLAHVLAEQVTELGYSAIIANDAQDALSLIATSDQIAAVLTDVLMPGGMSGLDLAHELKQRAPHIRLALMTGYNPEASKLNDPTIPQLLKPFSIDSLAKLLQEML